MKLTSFLIMLVVAFSSCGNASSQELSPADIDIYINVYDGLIDYIENTFQIDPFFEEQEHEYPALLGEAMLTAAQIPFLELLGDTYSKKKIIKAENFMDYKAPREVEAIFKKAGWKRNGQKKFAVILFGALYLTAKNADSKAESGEAIIPEDAASMIYQILGKKDLELINAHLDRVSHLFKWF